jgi:hypothetical protein
MGFWVGVAVVVALVIVLAAWGNRTRRGNTAPWLLSRNPGGGQAERNATGSTVTGNIQNDDGPSGF